jgi:hypothetical protein
MNMLFCATSPGLYSFFMNKAYGTSYFPFPIEIDAVPNFAACQTDNNCETLKATHAHIQKPRSDIVTKNAAHSNVFLANLTKAIRKTHKPICMKEPNKVFLHMFDWFISKYGKTTTKDSKENQQNGRPPTGILPKGLSPSQHASLLAHCMQVWHAT